MHVVQWGARQKPRDHSWAKKGERRRSRKRLAALPGVSSGYWQNEAAIFNTVHPLCELSHPTEDQKRQLVMQWVCLWTFSLSAQQHTLITMHTHTGELKAFCHVTRLEATPSSNTPVPPHSKTCTGPTEEGGKTEMLFHLCWNLSLDNVSDTICCKDTFKTVVMVYL